MSRAPSSLSWLWCLGLELQQPQNSSAVASMNKVHIPDCRAAAASRKGTRVTRVVSVPAVSSQPMQNNHVQGDVLASSFSPTSLLRGLLSARFVISWVQGCRCVMKQRAFPQTQYRQFSLHVKKPKPPLPPPRPRTHTPQPIKVLSPRRQKPQTPNNKTQNPELWGVPPESIP